MAIIHWKRTPFPEADVTWDSWSLFDQFNKDWDRLFERSTVPALDVLETEEDCVIWVDVPGLEKKDLEISISGSILSLKGEKSTQKANGKEKESPARSELWSGKFERTVQLPDSVDPEKVTADLKEGVLKVTVAKKSAWKARQIAIA